jgi:hypothetical protein
VSAIAPELTAAGETAPVIPSFLELEITGFCQLNCVHCYADSGPRGGPGTMTTADWERVIDQAAAIGVTMVQFIGGCFRSRCVPCGPCLISQGLDWPGNFLAVASRKGIGRGLRLRVMVSAAGAA